MIAALALLASSLAAAPAVSTTAAVSPDGSRIAFLSTRAGLADLFVISVDGTEQRQLTKTPEEEGAPGWMPGGKRLWFSVQDGNASRLLTVEPDGSHLEQIGSVPGRAAQIAPDGASVLYTTGSWTEVTL